MPRIGIVACETSGDILGASLIAGLRRKLPQAAFVGVGGPRMIEAGCRSLFPMDRLAVMGLVEVLSKLPELLAVRRQLRDHFLGDPPDVFIGVDAPDFNLGLESALKRAGIATAHYVSPTVWAWRPGRVRQIAAAVDLMLSVYPFEAAFLRSNGVPVTYVGHPLADEIPVHVDQAAARRALGVSEEGEIVAILPGSRLGEVSRLTAPFLRAARWCLERRPGLQFMTPLVNDRVRRAFDREWHRVAPGLPLRTYDGRSREVLLASDAVLTASGTATLEALLLKRPMVVGYRMNWLTYLLVKSFRMVKVPHVAMANLLAGEELAPEYIQWACRGDKLGRALLGFFDAPDEVGRIQSRYTSIHQRLRDGIEESPEDAVLALLEARGAL